MNNEYSPSNYPYPQEFSPPAHTSSKIWVFLGIFGVLILVVFFIFLFSKTSKFVSDEEMSRGISIGLKQSKEIKFEIENIPHRLKVKEIYSDYVVILIPGNATGQRLNIGETKKFDLNRNQRYDLSVRLINISNGKADIFIHKIDELICVENWECNNWSACVNGVQTRICTDLNNCRTLNGKPIEEQLCMTTCSFGDGCKINCSTGDLDCSCLQQNATICNATEICNRTAINSSESGTCCPGECIVGTPTIIDCGQDWNCFIGASQNCELSKMLATSTINLFEMLITASTFSELKGIETNKCVYYQRTEAMNIKFSEALIQQMLSEGSTQEQINQAEQSANDSAQQTIGIEQTCKFVSVNLTTMLQKGKQGSSSGGASCSVIQGEWSCVYSGDYEGAGCEVSCYPGSNCEELLNS